MGLGISSNLPMWQMPNYSSFSTPFAFDNGNIWGNFSSSSSSTSTQNETYEQYVKRREEEQKAAAQKALEKQATAELTSLKQDKIKELEIDKTIEAQKQTKAQIEKSKKSDGSSAVRTPYKKQGFWGKVGRWFSNAGSAVVNIGKNLVGIEKDGSWNWKKCLKNVAITAAAVGACFIPVVGPAIGYGLAATGVAMGAYGTVKGISNLNKASKNDDEAIDNAQQEVITGAITAITSAFGLRGIGKGVSASNASTAAERTSAAGKAWQSVSQFGRDITVNAWKATGKAMKADKALIASQSGKLGITKFFKATGKKVSSAYNGARDWETIYKNKYKETETSIQNRLNEVTNKLTTEKNPAKKALLEEEKSMLELNIEELHSLGTTVKTKADYEKLLKDNNGIFNKEYAAELETTVNGVSIAPKKLEMFNKRVQKFQNAYSKKLAELIKAKNGAMYQKAGNYSKYTRELKEYVPKRDVESFWYKPSTWRKNEYQLAIGKENVSNNGRLLNLTLIHPATTVPKTIQIVDPIYSVPFGFGEEVSAEQYEETIKNLDLQIEQLEQAEKAINECKNVTELNAIVAQLKQITDGTAQAEQSQEQQTDNKEAKDAKDDTK